MGWNSYDAWGTSVGEAETLANARYMRDHLLAHGWRYVVIDARWYDAVSSYDDRQLTKERAGAKLAADRFGRLMPDEKRFPSAAGGAGFKPLADQLHAMGLRFGIHVMRGVPRQAVKGATPIEGSTFTAADAGNPKNHCSWCPDMFGVRNTPAGQAWYDSAFRLYAAWGLDFIKVDDLSVPYSGAEIAMIRRAIDRCGRPIVFSTSPGPTDPAHADQLKGLANQWRISGDFWDRWKDLDQQFDLFAKWDGVGGPGHFPDGDMIPFDHIGIRDTIAGRDRQSRFTPDEQQTLMSLWSLASSPLILGNNLPDTDDRLLALLTNDEVLALDQDPAGAAAKRAYRRDGMEAWVKPLPGGAAAVGVFNRTGKPIVAKLSWSDLGLAGPLTVRDLWHHAVIDPSASELSPTVPPHGAVLIRVTPAA
jgi:hypothetical protein